MPNDNEYTPTERKYGHGCITFTHYPSSQRVAVVQVGTNAVMDSWEFVEFAKESGLLAEHDREVAEKALRHVQALRGGDIEQEYIDAALSPYRGTPGQEGKPRLSSGHPDYWCHVCNRGLEGCEHPPAPTESEGTP